jgi:hypothetical protein
VPARLLCVAEQWASAAYLGALVRRWLSHPPSFDWRLAASEPLIGTLRDEPDLAARLIAVDPTGQLGVADWRPSALFVSAGGLPREFAFVAVGRALGLDLVQFVDTWYGYGRRFTKDGMVSIPDRILVIDDKAVEEAAAEGVPAARMTAAGHPVWECIERLPPTASRDVLFLDAPVTRDYGDRLGYSEDDCWSMLRAAKLARPDLVGRILFAPHPDNARSDQPADVEVTRYRVDMLKSVGTVIGMFSAPLVDAFLAGRRSITLQPGATDVDMCPLSRHGRIVRRRTVDELVAALAEPPADPNALASALAGSAARVTAAIEAEAA